MLQIRQDMICKAMNLSFPTHTLPGMLDWQCYWKLCVFNCTSEIAGYILFLVLNRCYCSAYMDISCSHLSYSNILPCFSLFIPNIYDPKPLTSRECSRFSLNLDKIITLIGFCTSIPKFDIIRTTK